MFENQLKELFELTKTKNMNQLSKYFGFENNSTVSKWKKNGRIPEQYMLKAENEHLKSLQINKIQHNFNINSTQIQIPIFKNQAVSAGKGLINFDDECEVVVFNKLELKMMFRLTSLKNLGILRVIGNSMYPTINEGEMLVFQDDGTAYEGGIYVVEYDGELFVKRLYKRPKIMLKSDNEDYEPIMLNEDEEFRIIGRVVGTYKIEHKAL